MNNTQYLNGEGLGAVPCSASFLIQKLKQMHPQNTGWQFVEELRVGTGFGGVREQRFDAWAIQAWQKNGLDNLRRSFEVKICAADLRVELLNSDKRWFAHAYSHEFFFVSPAGLCDKRRLAKDEGLIEWDGDQMKIVKQAARRDAMPPRWDFVASLVRTIYSQNDKLMHAIAEPLEGQ